MRMARAGTSNIASSCGLHSSRFRRPMWKKERRSLSLTWGWRSWKQFLIFFRMSGLSWETMEPPVHESLEVPGVGGCQGVRGGQGVRGSGCGLEVRLDAKGVTGNSATLGCQS